MTAAELEAWQGLLQDLATTSEKPEWLTQKFSNRKRFVFGILDSIESTHGMWSETGFPKGRTIVLGKEVVQFEEEKNQSSCSRSGSSCILLHVKALPLTGISIKDCARISSLNNSISEASPPSLFLLSVDRMKLKSPKINHFSSSGILRSNS